MSKKVVLKLHIHDDKDKQKALKTVSSFSGIECIAMDMKEKKLTVIGDVDPVEIVRKLRKLWATDMLTVGPADKKRSEDDEANKGGEGKKEDEAKKKESEVMNAQQFKIHFPYSYYNNNAHHCHAYTAEDYPIYCVIS